MLLGIPFPTPLLCAEWVISSSLQKWSLPCSFPQPRDCSVGIGGTNWFTLLFAFRHTLASRSMNNSGLKGPVEIYGPLLSAQSRGIFEFHAGCTVSCQLSFDYFHGWRFHSLIGHLVSILDHPHRNVLPTSNQNFLFCIFFFQSCLVLLLFTFKKSVAPSLR